MEVDSEKLNANYKFYELNSISSTSSCNGDLFHSNPHIALFRVSDYAVSTVAINRTGDWLGIGCGQGSNAQLIVSFIAYSQSFFLNFKLLFQVWEWQSETYALKQQSHSQRISTISYSPDGSLLATGAEDGKVIILGILIREVASITK